MKQLVSMALVLAACGGSDDDGGVETDGRPTGLPARLHITASTMGEAGRLDCFGGSTSFQLTGADIDPALRFDSGGDPLDCSISGMWTIACDFVTDGQRSGGISVTLASDLSGGTGRAMTLPPGNTMPTCTSVMTLTAIELR